MTRVQRAAHALADTLASREIAKQKSTWPDTQEYWNEMVARRRALLKQACRDAGVPAADKHVGAQLPLPWRE